MDLAPLPRSSSILAEDWTFLPILFCLAMVAYGKYFEPRQINRIWSSIFNVRLMRQEMREETQHRRASVLYFLLFTFSLALLLQYASADRLQHTLGQVHGSLVFVMLSLFVALVYLVKGAVTHVVSHLAAGDFSLTEYRYSFYLINQLAGLLLFPLAVLAAYSDPKWSQIALIAAFCVLSALISYRWLRGIIHAIQKGVPVFYIFFYICSLEFLPLALFASFIRQNVYMG